MIEDYKMGAPPNHASKDSDSTSAKNLGQDLNDVVSMGTSKVASAAR